MNEIKHTPEPWSVYEGEEIHGVLDSTGRHLAEMWMRKGWDSKANARRIVACVNACAGMADPAAEIAALRAEVVRRDDLLDDIERALEDHGLTCTLAAIREERAALAASPEAPEPVGKKRPRIVCLCGSTRFMDAYQAANLRETLAGRIVLSIGCNTKSEADFQILGKLTPDAKAALDELHKRKIDLADEILVLNIGGYIGESTRSEIAYAERHGKAVRYLERAAEKGEGER